MDLDGVEEVRDNLSAGYFDVKVDASVEMLPRTAVQRCKRNHAA